MEEVEALLDNLIRKKEERLVQVVKTVGQMKRWKVVSFCGKHPLVGKDLLVEEVQWQEKVLKIDLPLVGAVEQSAAKAPS